MFVTNWISPTKIQKISEITNFFRHYFLSRTEVKNIKLCLGMINGQKYLSGFEWQSLVVVRYGRHSLYFCYYGFSLEGWG